MATGACGINCDVCRLRLLGTCSSCGAGGSSVAEAKRAAQERILGQPCPVLACAIMNKVSYCPRDCLQFPCDNFNYGPYPFSRSYLDMQQRRFAQLPPALDPNGRPLKVPEQYWKDLLARPCHQVCNATLVEVDQQGGFVFNFFNRRLQVTPSSRSIKAELDGKWQLIDDPLLELVTLAYLTGTERVFPLKNQLVGVKDLKEGFYFQGRHAMPLAPLLERFADDPAGFATSCRTLGGQEVAMADVGFKLLALPRIPLYLLLWQAGDEEIVTSLESDGFGARIDILFDRSVEKIFPAAVIWMLVRRLVVALLQFGI